MEIDTEITNLLVENAAEAPELVFNKALPIGNSKAEHYEGFAEIVELAKREIYDRTRRFMPNYMLIASDVLPILTFIKGFKAAPVDKVNGPYYYFTNVEREYFKAKRRIVLESLPLQERGSIKIYLIDKDAKFNLDKILHIPDMGKDVIMDTIDACVNGQYLIISENEYNEFGVVVYRETGEIIFNTDLSKYSYIIVDYMKKDSYAINFDYDRQSYSVDISTSNKSVSVIYDNIETNVGAYEYINEQQYVDSKIIPSENCYIVIGK